ncbi:protein BIG GRAIN 1-like B [Cannabis sativa]|uniref:protein BIG GRAIN 1-like B n=1 Tax=Cannabis sativa TaxID=3483 RepID=UPI0029CA8280|nr:protein BIG GRAIN 1-like B [Cannabis sativa]
MYEMYRYREKTPSFSSTLLEKIYRSIDEGNNTTMAETTKSDNQHLKFYRETTMAARKQSKVKIYRAGENEEDEMDRLRRACLIDKWIGKKVGNNRRRDYNECSEFEDGIFFSSTSSSSDSSSGGFSSSDSDSIYFNAPARSASNSFPGPALPKPVRITEKNKTTTFYETSKLENDDVLIKSKSRALRIYSNLKKVKQPISPGGKLATFINSLFTSGNGKKSSSKSVQQTHETTPCSSASSFSRSCLSKNSSASRREKRSVRFCPDEDIRKKKDENFPAVRVPTAWKIGPSPAPVEKSRRVVSDVAKEFLKEYRQNQQKGFKNDNVKRGNDVVLVSSGEENDGGAAFDDGASCSSSDLFELDHLEELPVYETTRVNNKNRVISFGR